MKYFTARRNFSMCVIVAYHMKTNGKKRFGSGPFNPSSGEPYKVSRSKIDLFTECERCAYLDMRLGGKRPSMPAFPLNNAGDELLKPEFDVHRVRGGKHP